MHAPLESSAQAIKTFWQDTLGIRLNMSTVDEYYGLNPVPGME